MLEAVGEHPFYLMLWNEVLKPRLKGSGIQMVDFTANGLRLSNGGKVWEGWPNGIGADLLITTDALSENAGAPQLCRCAFGKTYTYCSAHSKEMLTEHYGTDFMIPKSQCDYYRDLGHPNWAWRS